MFRMNFFYKTLVVSLGFFAGCGNTKDQVTNNQPQSGSSNAALYRKITPQQAKKMMGEGDPYIILDVRTEAEFNEIHIEGATLIPLNEISSRAQTGLPDKNMLVFIYCRSGGRSANAAHELVKMGYTNVYDIGGIISWPYETVK